MSKPNPSPNAFPKLCKRFSARFQLIGRGTVPSFSLWREQIFLKIKLDLMRPILCYGEVLRFFNTSQSFDQITTLTYVLVDNVLSLFYLLSIVIQFLCTIFIPSGTLPLYFLLKNKNYEFRVLRMLVILYAYLIEHCSV